MDNFINNVTAKFDIKLYNISKDDNDYIQKFIFGIYYSKAVITNSYHGVLFSIIFNKPFIAFNFKSKGGERFNTLKEIFNLKNRIYQKNQKPDINLINKKLYINNKILKYLKRQSIKFLKINLNIKNLLYNKIIKSNLNIK